MTTRKLDRSEWQPYFDDVSRSIGEHEVEIEIISPAFGDQIAAGPLGNQARPEHATLHGLTYDPNSDALEVVTESLDHLIRRPREIHVQEADGVLQNVEALDGDGNKQIITLKPPLPLPVTAP